MSDVCQRMRDDWNQRAREDANFYVAFGRREQDDEEFFSTAAEVVRGLESEMRRLPAAANRRAWRALEIGCGPGRLLRPMSKHFGEIHGVDVSDEMIGRARANLSGIAHAHAHHTTGSDLAAFADDSFELVYSYAVFQHIPSHDVVMQYLREAHRVLRTGGILRVQINGLDKTAKEYDTWSGVRISAEEVREFAREHNMQLLALEGTRTQYMWTTMRKRGSAWRERQAHNKTRIRRITNAHNSEPVAPQRGRFASVTLWTEHLPSDCDLNTLTVLVDRIEAFPCYIGPPEADGLQQLNVMLPDLPRTGLLPVQMLWNGRAMAPLSILRVIPAGPRVPVVLSVTDGINMLSGNSIVSGTIKATVEEAPDADSFSASIDGQPVEELDVFCADPGPPRHEMNFHVPKNIGPGAHVLTVRLGRRSLGNFNLIIV